MNLRLRPAIVAAVLLVMARLLPVVYPAGGLIGALGSLLLTLAIVVWWLFFSRTPWLERLGVLAAAVLLLVATSFVVHPSIRGGMMRNMVWVAPPPDMAFGLVLGLLIARRMSPAARRVAAMAGIIAGCALWTMLRTDGIKGTGGAQLHLRWTPTAEARLLAAPAPAPAASAPLVSARAATPSTASPAPSATAAPALAAPTASEKSGVAKPADAPVAALPTASASVPVRWAGFRGSARDSVVHGVRVATDWSTSPPVELWKHAIGPGWSSFAVRGKLIYTQEQRGEREIVACYDSMNGQLVWTHQDPVRFYESNGGAGPRATPALSGGRVFALGATGVLNALDADTGALLWSHNSVTDTGVKIPGWGITGSPIVVQDLVVVAASGGLAAYDIASGARRWVRRSSGGSYSSPHLVTIDGVPQVLLMMAKGAISVSPVDGKVLWEFKWEGVPIVQPAVIDNGDLLLTTAGMMGGEAIKRVTVTHGAAGWNAEERWTSTGLKPYFNDYVVHKGYAFGFDGSILSCIDLSDGTRKWKGGRFGNGQMVLLADEDVLLVLSEDGELALVSATPDQFKEIARIPALEGKTWNHPVLVGDLLLVRNGDQMAAYRLPQGHD